MTSFYQGNPGCVGSPDDQAVLQAQIDAASDVKPSVLLTWLGAPIATFLIQRSGGDVNDLYIAAQSALWAVAVFVMLVVVTRSARGA